MSEKEPSWMKNDEPGRTTRAFEEALSEAKLEHYVLVLYVTGATPQSTQAIIRIKEICEEYLQGRYELEVVDIYQQPELARSAQIVAAPTLIKKLPAPLRRLIGNLSESQTVLAGLDLKPGG
jgi:circadian clock protein KaiB